MSQYDQLPSSWFRRCGRSGLKLPAISLGCWHNFGAPGTGSAGGAEEATFHENCRQMLIHAFERGITHFDLANNYGPPPGSAEERVGRILKELPRDELIISTKAGYGMWAGPYGDGGSRKYLLASLDQSLRRLGLDYVDIFYHHRPDSETPLEETLGALDQAVRSGKALYAGISNYSGAQTADLLLTAERAGLVQPIIHQPSYSMLNRRPESDLFPITTRFGLGTIGFCPLQQGLLTRKYLHGIPDDSRAASASGFLRREAITPEVIAKVQRLNEVAEGRGQTLAQMALAWVVRPGAATSALIGASRPEQIEENVRAVSGAPFSDEELRRIDAVLSGAPAG
jgi:L-glyceraldehyde 3-phosphate reductase